MKKYLLLLIISLSVLMFVSCNKYGEEHFIDLISEKGEVEVLVSNKNILIARTGETVKFKFVPLMGWDVYTFEIYETANIDNKVSSVNKEFVMPDYDITIKVTYEEIRLPWNYKVMIYKEISDTNYEEYHGLGYTTGGHDYIATSFSIVSKTTAEVAQLLYNVSLAMGNSYVIDELNPNAINEGMLTKNNELILKYYFCYNMKNIIIDQNANGTVEVASTATVGHTIDFVVTPNEGFQIDEILFLDVNGEEVNVNYSKKNNTIKMPGVNLTIKVTFGIRTKSTYRIDLFLQDEDGEHRLINEYSYVYIKELGKWLSLHDVMVLTENWFLRNDDLFFHQGLIGSYVTVFETINEDEELRKVYDDINKFGYELNWELSWLQDTIPYDDSLVLTMYFDREN